MGEEGVSEPEDGTVEITQSEEQRKQASGMVTEDLTFMSSEIQKRPEEKQVWLKEYLEE